MSHVVMNVHYVCICDSSTIMYDVQTVEKCTFSSLLVRGVHVIYMYIHVHVQAADGDMVHVDRMRMRDSGDRLA